MTVEEYLIQNQNSIVQECQNIANGDAKAIITVKDNDASYIHQVSTVEEFTSAMPDTKFFETMRKGITNAVLNKVVPVVIFEGQKARITTLPNAFN